MFCVLEPGRKDTSYCPKSYEKNFTKNFQDLLDLSNSRLRVSAGWRKNHVSSSLRGLFYSLSAGGIGLAILDDVEVLVVDDLACGGLRVCFCRIQVVRVV